MSNIPSITPTPEITIPLREYIDLAIRHKEFAAIEPCRALLIKSLDPNETLCHVKMPGDFKDMPEHDCKVPHLYRKSEWDTEYSRWLRIKQRSAAEREVSCLSRELAGDVAKVLVEQLGLESEEAYVLARKLVEKDNDVFARKFGIDLQELKDKRRKLLES